MNNVLFYFATLFAITLTSCDNQSAEDRSPAIAKAEIISPQSTETVASRTDGLEWYDINELENLREKGDKGVLIDVYTDWCGWCKVMDKKTFTDQEVIDHLNENYYLIKFNAEQKAAIAYNGKEYKWVSGGRRGVNTLAYELLNRRLSYPSLVVLDASHQQSKVIVGYKTPDQLLSEMEAIQFKS